MFVWLNNKLASANKSHVSIHVTERFGRGRERVKNFLSSSLIVVQNLIVFFTYTVHVGGPNFLDTMGPAP